MKLIVDRIEDGYAVCEREDKSRVHIPLSELPPGAREGEHYRFDGSTFLRDKDSEQQARQRNIALQKSLFADD